LQNVQCYGRMQTYRRSVGAPVLYITKNSVSTVLLLIFAVAETRHTGMILLSPYAVNVVLQCFILGRLDKLVQV